MWITCVLWRPVATGRDFPCLTVQGNRGERQICCLVGRLSTKHFLVFIVLVFLSTLQPCVKIWNSNLWPNEWKRSIYITIPKTGHLKSCPYYCIITLWSHISKILLQIIMTIIKKNWIIWNIGRFHALGAIFCTRELSLKNGENVMSTFIPVL